MDACLSGKPMTKRRLFSLQLASDIPVNPSKSQTAQILLAHTSRNDSEKRHDDDILDMARHCCGYGRWEAKYRFIGRTRPAGRVSKNDAKRGLTFFVFDLACVAATVTFVIGRAVHRGLTST
jgi:hypothetical protein